MEKGDFFFVLKFFVVLSLPVNTDQDHFMLNLISVVSNEVSILLCVFLIHTVAERINGEFRFPGKVIKVHSITSFVGITLNQGIGSVLA